MKTITIEQMTVFVNNMSISNKRQMIYFLRQINKLITKLDNPLRSDYLKIDNLRSSIQKKYQGIISKILEIGITTYLIPEEKEIFFFIEDQFKPNDRQLISRKFYIKKEKETEKIDKERQDIKRALSYLSVEFNINFNRLSAMVFIADNYQNTKNHFLTKEYAQLHYKIELSKFLRVETHKRRNGMLIPSNLNFNSTEIKVFNKLLSLCENPE